MKKPAIVTYEMIIWNAKHEQVKATSLKHETVIE
jgi:hypothetical protein